MPVIFMIINITSELDVLKCTSIDLVLHVTPAMLPSQRQLLAPKGQVNEGRYQFVETLWA